MKAKQDQLRSQDFELPGTKIKKNRSQSKRKKKGSKAADQKKDDIAGQHFLVRLAKQMEVQNKILEDQVKQQREQRLLMKQAFALPVGPNLESPQGSLLHSPISSNNSVLYLKKQQLRNINKLRNNNKRGANTDME